MAGDVSIKDLELLALNYLGTVPMRKTVRAVAVEALKVTTMGRYLLCRSNTYATTCIYCKKGRHQHSNSLSLQTLYSLLWPTDINSTHLYPYLNVSFLLVYVFISLVFLEANN